MDATDQQTDAMRTYAALMVELKLRMTWIQYVIHGRSGMDGQMVREFGFLQLRMCCELVALGCLVAHGDIPATKVSRFQRAFSADEIIKGLENLTPTAFPHSVIATVTPVGGLHLEEHGPEADVMTKAELLNLYGRECGNILHKGSLKNLLQPQSPVQKHFPELFTPAQRMMNLLGAHRFALDDGFVQFICILGDHAQDVRIVLGMAPRQPS